MAKWNRTEERLIERIARTERATVLGRPHPAPTREQAVAAFEDLFQREATR